MIHGYSLWFRPHIQYYIFPSAFDNMYLRQALFSALHTFCGMLPCPASRQMHVASLIAPPRSTIHPLLLQLTVFHLPRSFPPSSPADPRSSYSHSGLIDSGSCLSSRNWVSHFRISLPLLLHRLLLRPLSRLLRTPSAIGLGGVDLGFRNRTGCLRTHQR